MSGLSKVSPLEDRREIYATVADGDALREGHAIIARGRHDREAVEAAVTYDFGGGWTRVVIEEQHLSLQSRVMWCERYGSPCDYNGEWHAHWHPVLVNPYYPDAAIHTVALPIWGGES